MQKSILVDLLSTLSTKEHRKFREFAHSPYHNKNEKVKKLADILYSSKADFKQPKLAKSLIYAKIYPEDRVFRELRINNLISDLLQLLYAFLAQEVYQEKVLLQKKYLLDSLTLHDADRHIEKNLRNYEQLHKKSNYRSYDHFLEAYYLNEEADQQQLRRAMRSNEGHFQKQNDALDLFFHINKFRIACDMTSRNLVAQAGYQCRYLDDLLRWYEEGSEKIQQEPVLQLYYKALQMLRHQQEEKWFTEVRKILREQYQFIPQAELWQVYNFALNFCIIRINTGHSAFYQEILQLYKELLERKIIFVNGYLTQWSFKNIITTGIRLQEFDWTEQFIHHYQSYLLPEEKENAIVYNLAVLYHAKEDYSQALQLLHNVEFTDSSYHLGAKTIQLKSFYKLRETEALFALLEAFRKYLTRNRQISDYRKKANNNMLKLVKKIYQLRANQNLLATANFKRRQRHLDQQLKSIRPIANKDWLEEVFLEIGI